MILRNVKFIVVAAYILTIALGALASGVTSGAGLTVFTAVALLPCCGITHRRLCLRRSRRRGDELVGHSGIGDELVGHSGINE
jgi:hypothetical protein